MANELDAYRRKRDFAATSEPKGKRSRTSGFRFVVQKHAARRLHYDFRLELDGVLKSWAVAKGPSLVPGEKRLAVHVEDHPLDYADFEGVIPPGQYGAGSVMVWDKGTWRPEGDPHKGYAKGHLSFTLEGEKLRGQWNLVRMRPREGERGDNWLLIKSHDEAARTADAPDVLEEEPLSVATGRSIAQIGEDRKSRRWQSGRAASQAAPTIAGAKTPRQRVAEPPPAQAKSAATPKRRSAKQERKFALPDAARKAAMPTFVPPELATLSARPPKGEWLHEIKLDGYRIQAALREKRVALRTRKGLDWTDRFPGLASALATLPAESALIDGEAVVEDAHGISDFAALQVALKEAREGRIRFYAFDLLYLDGYDLTAASLLERKALLASLLRAGGSDLLVYSEHLEGDGEKMLRHVCELKGEEIVSKLRRSLYRSGRSSDWLKAKCANRQEFVVVGFVPSTNAPRAVGSLVLGYWDNRGLVHAGRAGTGFSRLQAAELYKLLAPARVNKPPVSSDLSTQERRSVVWVRPEKVAEIEFRGWTRAGQVRQASFKGVREDKDAKEVVREDAVLAQSASAGSPPPDPAAARLTHPDRVLWPEAGVTKQALADYYALVWSRMEPFVTNRPLALLRCPSGIAHGCFFQKHAWEGMSDSVRQLRDPQEEGPILAIDGLGGLLALVQASALEIHPWGARADDMERPDMIVLDLDPGEGVAWADLAAAAREARERLRALGLQSFVKTSGGKGLHVVAPLKPRAGWQVVKGFCKDLAEAMAHDSPSRFIATMAKKARANRVYVDYLRNGRGQTAVAAYSTRARPACGISTPLAWDELDSVKDGARFTLPHFKQRLASAPSDPWADFFALDQRLPESRGRKRAAP